MTDSQQKKFNIDEVSTVVGQEPQGSIPGDPAVQATPAVPSKSIGKRMYQRFWGSDVTDPHPYSRMAAQLVGGLGGAYGGAEAGAAVGAAGGAAVGGPVGAPIGAGIGAAIGGVVGGLTGTMAGTAAPEGLMEAGEFLGVMDPGTRERNGLSNEDLKTVLEGEALLDLATGGGVMIARQGIRGAAKLFTGTGAKARKMADIAAKDGINMLPVQVGDRTVARGFVSVLGRFPLVAGPIRRNIRQSELQFKEAFEKLPADIAPIATMSDVSHSVMMDAKGLFTSFSKQMHESYTDVFKRAEEAGVKVTPSTTTTKVQELLDTITKETPTAAMKSRKVAPASDMQEVTRFINKSVAPIFKQTKSGATTIANQSLPQMDSLLTSIDQQIGTMVKNGASKRAIMRLQDLKQAVQTDMYTHLVDPTASAQVAKGSAGYGNQAIDVAADLKALDQKYTLTMADLFETTAAKKFGTVSREGLKGMGFDNATRTSVDNLTEVLVRGESVTDLQDLAKLTKPETFKTLAASVLAERFNKGYVTTADGLQRFDLQRLRSSLGLGNPTSKRYLHTKKLLELAGGLDMKHVEDLFNIGTRIGAVEAPDVSTFMARSGTMGGYHALVGTILPGMAAGYAASGHAGMAMASGLLSSGMLIGGANMIGRMITDPKISRLLITVMKPETKKAARKAAWLRAGQMAVVGLKDAAIYTEDEAMHTYEWLKGTADLIDKEADKKLQP